MGTQGLSGRAVLKRRGGDGPWLRIAAAAVSLAILPLAVGCSQSSSFGSSAPQASTVPPPSPAYGQAPGQPTYAQQPARPGYPPQAQGGNPQPASYAAAPPAQPPQSSDGATVGSFTSSYAGFLKAFRDPEPDPSSEAARASVYPQRSLADMFKGSTDSNQRTDAGGAGYPQQALVPSAGGAPPQQNAYVPHPPSTYTASGQPYTPPPGQAGYAPPPATPQNYVPPPNPPRSGQQSSTKPTAKQTIAARSAPQNAPPPAPPAAPPPVAAAAPARDYSDSMPYPKQSLTDVFRWSTDSQAQSVPQPPSTYAPSGQPYSPQGQAANGAQTASAPPPANPDPASSGPYPKQSLFEVFSGK
jgi:hypothetical protein